jgi:hypothetical protein
MINTEFEGSVVDIFCKSLTTFDVAPDGTFFRMNFVDVGDRPATVVFPAECLSELLMTIPRIVTQAMRAKYGDSSLRLVYPLADWQLETAAGDRRLILTLKTADGFEVAFALGSDDLQAMMEATGNADPATEITLPIH